MDPIVVATTIKLATLTTLILFLLGVPVALWLSDGRNKSKLIVEAVLSLPLILPPTVLGYYLLVFLSPESTVGKYFEQVFQKRIPFSFEGILFASVIFGIPFMIQPMKAALDQLPSSLKEASYTLGKSKIRTAIAVLLPNIKSSLLSAIILTFVHATGEFGVVLMMGGNIPGETRVASIAIYDEVQAMNYHSANIYSIALLSASFFALLTVHYLNRKSSDLQ